MTVHARRYGAEIASGRVATLEHGRDHFRATLEDGEIIAARGVILATGVETNLAELDEGDHMTAVRDRSEEHTSELKSLMRTSYAVLCLKKKSNDNSTDQYTNNMY